MEYELKTPLKDEDISKLEAGDVVYITGKIHTARDSAHKRIIEEGAPIDLNGVAIFHAGPVIREDDNGKYEVIAVGPTTSMRMNPYEPQVLDMGVKAIIGKGGMDDATQKALVEDNAVFLTAVGGCAALYVSSINEVSSVNWLDLGMPEAIWELDVERFGPLIVTMDSKNNNLYKRDKKMGMKNEK
ncbi:FumA C-terminus/TtdB family hydratase beta subunit [Methanosphaera cuniculi]|uniref:Fumarate hydratase n=2 Tax=Methanosphaera cuniculi TaxID=1077256 RepID=A0A2A2HFG3_9EURY|nr:FumA C-terminus/TtdB family hydratase beta subunit [Methanosphaera cuniculi]PAV08137.1 fumarate hydratase [Methanosphaera cuniculi]PWL07775.1 L(+)-tartrate dehydratase subunit beta [Methanosphaera cuniculi]